jgi:hypothetical protein
MSKIEVDAIEPQSGTSLTIGASGDTITIPSGATLTNSGTATGFGKVLQVVSTTSTTQYSTTSTSMVALSPAISASITPSSASNKILLLCSLAFGANNAQPRFTIYRSGSDLIPSGVTIFAGTFSADQYQLENSSFQYLDSPNTTSSTSYELYWRSDGGTTVYLGRRANDTVMTIPTTITLMEIAG